MIMVYEDAARDRKVLVNVLENWKFSSSDAPKTDLHLLFEKINQLTLC